ncbi:flippase [Chryseobacterium gotjawalense]|uniref:Flippase n=1 Tax=Chryseobacterium gotjawalense TaxID=3042315 RepID=A0ABY8RGD9_9FLAO|nr:flippase [Chryseobacterium sp. wdc7]WHF53050.1 flippase [Chryseobacterium sp. wdc7]
MSLQKNFLYNLLLIVSQLLFPLLILPYVNRLLGPSQMGLYSMADSLAQYFITIAALGIPIYGVREIAKARSVSNSKFNAVFSELLTINSLFTGVFLLVYAAFFYFSEVVSVNRLVYGIASLQVLAGLFSLEWFFQGIENFKFIALRTFIIRMGSILLIFIFVKDAGDGIVYFSITTGTMVLSATVNLFFLRKAVRYQLPSQLHLMRHIKPLLTFFSTKFMISVYVTLTTVLLGFLSTTTDVGYFSLSFKIFNIIVIIVSSLTTVALARTSNAAGDRDRLMVIVGKISSFNLVVGLPAAALVFLYAKELVLLLGGTQFIASIVSLQYFAVLAFIIPFSNLFALNILTPLKKEKLFLTATIVGTVVSLTLNILLMPTYGYLGATFSFVVTELIVCILLYRAVIKVSPYRFDFYLLATSFIGCLLLIPIYFLVPEMNSYIRLIVSLTASGIVYLSFHLFVAKTELVRKILKFGK